MENMNCRWCFYGIKPDVCRDGFGTDMAYAAW